MSWGRTCLGVDHFLQRPPPSVHIVLVEIIDSIEAVIAAKDVYSALVHDSGVSVTRRRRRIVYRQDFGPLESLEVEFEEIVASVGPIVSSEYVEVVVKGDRSM